MHLCQPPVWKAVAVSTAVDGGKWKAEEDLLFMSIPRHLSNLSTRMKPHSAPSEISNTPVSHLGGAQSSATCKWVWGLLGREVHYLVLFVPRGDLAGCNPISPGRPVLKSRSPGLPQLPRVSPVLCVLCGCHSLRRFCWGMLARDVVIWRHNDWDFLDRIVKYNRWRSSEVNLCKILAAFYFCVSVSLCGFFNSFKNFSLSI